jgi:hypothetical protein
MNTERDTRLATYPVLTFAARYRRTLPVFAALLILLLGAWASVRTDSIDFFFIGLIVAPLVHFVTKGVLELVALVTELLIPQ